ncbi:Ser/Thr protein phosphatase [Tritrichomonas foetus]|uniref:Serine/threonine-protein phosphatase n=1 Tax=Tritrichomonas foetus TaxID=1144522 RepID=A0A1J4J270_9EUKA|nr:Ser/Thr protein phosphatase [Tritrichomonas foetus]|eukprot:OHS92849.1 Ser/Thr protein phosphatase [Tritrichomonas foetus]
MNLSIIFNHIRNLFEYESYFIFLSARNTKLTFMNSNSFFAPSFVLDNLRQFLSLEESQIPQVGNEIRIPSFQEEVLMQLCEDAIKAFRFNSPVIEVETPTVIIGDLHGNLHDLLRIWSALDDPFANKFVFLGDYVDRGQYQLETVILLLALAIQYPSNIFILRGNHEFRNINQNGGFLTEVTERYSKELWGKINDVFDHLLIAAIVDHKYFCVHGGIGPGLKLISDLNKCQLPIKDDSDPLLGDLFWSDPSKSVQNFAESNRGRGSLFGLLATHSFLARNKLHTIIRGHQSIKNGLQKKLDNKVITVFSSSSVNTNGKVLAGVLYIDQKNEMSQRIFHPIIVPKRRQAVFYNVKLPKSKTTIHSLTSYYCGNKRSSLISSLQSFTLNNSRALTSRTLTSKKLMKKTIYAQYVIPVSILIPQTIKMQCSKYDLHTA